MANVEMINTKNIVIFEADDCNDPTWDYIIEILRKNIPEFSVSYGKGDYMAFAIPKAM